MKKNRSKLDPRPNPSKILKPVTQSEGKKWTQSIPITVVKIIFNMLTKSNVRILCYLRTVSHLFALGLFAVS